MCVGVDVCVCVYSLRVSTVMILSLHRRWHVWLSASRPELKRRHSIHSLKERRSVRKAALHSSLSRTHTERAKLLCLLCTETVYLYTKLKETSSTKTCNCTSVSNNPCLFSSLKHHLTADRTVTTCLRTGWGPKVAP